MAPARRRPATRNHPSSTQEDVEEDGTYRPTFDQWNEPSLNENPVDTFRGTEQCRPQHDNPSQLLPGDENDIDFELEEHIGSQVLDEQEQEERQASTSYTQNALDAASVLAGGFASDSNNNVSASHSSATRSSATRSSTNNRRECAPVLHCFHNALSATRNPTTKKNNVMNTMKMWKSCR